MPVPVVPELLRAKVKVFVDLYRKTRQLERFNAELEQRVVERTAELRSFNEELEQRIEERTRERETALAQLFEAQKMDTIGRLTGGVAHDFNNLLMAVLGSLSLLEKRLPDDPQCRRLLQNAVQGAQRGAALTQRLLAFSRRQELKPEAVDLAELVSGMDELLKRALGPRNRAQCQFPSALPPVLVDANQLELALLNLALNARDAMPGGGSSPFGRGGGDQRARTARDSSSAARRVCAHQLIRHRCRHGRVDPREGDRPLLHHQGTGQGHRARIVDGARPGRAIRRTAAHRQRAERGHDRGAVAAARQHRTRSRGCAVSSARSPRPRRKPCRVLIVDDDRWC